MNNPWRSLRARLATLGFLAIYLPVLLLFGVILATDTEVTVEAGSPVESTRDLSGWPSATLLALGPAAALLAWWWAGRAVRPLHQVRAVAEDITATDLSRRIGLDHGAVEVTALADSFDAMLDRLDTAAELQRRLIEETSHELRVPLAVLMTNAEVLLAHPEPTLEVYRDGLERDRATAERLRRTIDDLLVDARGRARTVDRRPVDLMPLIRGLVDDSGLLATGRDVTVALGGPPTVMCRVDQPTVRRAVSNLLDNAIRHAPDGSTVDVLVEHSGGSVAVTVTDHGPGIPLPEQEQIFERFWHRGEANTGLGLPIVSQIAQAHGGAVTVVSPGPDGDGAVFRLTLR